MHELTRLQILHEEEQAARRRWAALRDERTELLVNARCAGIPASLLAESTGLTPARIYNIVRGTPGVPIDGDPSERLRTLTCQMDEEEAAAGVLARQRNEIATYLVQEGASAPFLAKTLAVNVETLRNWLYPRLP